MGSWSTNFSNDNDASGYAKTNGTSRINQKVFHLLEFYFIFVSLVFKSSIHSFANLREHILSKVADTLDEVSYTDGEFIVRQGARGDTFYIVSKGNWFDLEYQWDSSGKSLQGRAQITQGKSKWDTPVYVRHLERGDYFGEDALQS